MVKTLIPALLMIAALSSCSSLKPINSASSNNAVATKVSHPSSRSKDPKFIDDISVTANNETRKNEPAVWEKKPTSTSAITTKQGSKTFSDKPVSIEKASALQIKYAILLNTEVEFLQNGNLLEHIDEWYGTRYRMGGTGKDGIDCSAFVQTIYLSAFAVSLPRTARDQYKTCRIISSTQLMEGDLVFFNTRGGVSHVGIYLQNNKFVHASVSNGVTISDMFDPYYLKHFIGAGRIERSEAMAK
jgi:cell wall-associated NlpC family hydrolase